MRTAAASGSSTRTKNDVARDRRALDAQGLEQARQPGAIEVIEPLESGDREVERDAPVVGPVGAQFAAARVEDGRLRVVQAAGLEQHVRARQRRVSAQRHLDLRREPPQVVGAVGARQQEGGLASFISAATACIHASATGLGEQAHAPPDSPETPRRERVDA